MSVGPVEALRRCLVPPVVVVAGAGCSTESGIPDYRGEGTARRARNPLQHRAFVTDPVARRRYWARSFVGWPRIDAAAPNAGHVALAQLEAAGVLQGVITQNVDGLHHAAGSQHVVELHGALRRVVCLKCGQREARASVQERLGAANPHAIREQELLADGDADLEPASDFVVVDCLRCHGTLMPDVVFFGGSVPRERVDRSNAWVDAAASVLVVGSSLTVFSGYRFVKRAHEQRKAVAILNRGPTRADRIADVKAQLSAGEALQRLADLFDGTTDYGRKRENT
ncbi:MAG: NAD-dependent protein deacetylase [Myxococcales bacterium]|nr:NAD-dependent protein deacetylase [Myxococcales bacterium]